VGFEGKVKVVYARPLHPELIARLREIPGMGVGSRAMGTQLYVPTNAAGIVARMLTDWGVPVGPLRAYTPPTLPPWDVFSRIWTAPGQKVATIHPWLVSEGAATATEPVRLLPFQRAALMFAVSRGSAHLWQPPGSGKTLESIAWGCAAPGDVLVVTRAPARETHRREWMRFTPIEPYVIKPQGSVRKRDRWQSIEDYVADTGDERRVVVIGWEQLVDRSAAALAALRPGFSVIYDEAHRAKQPKRARWVHEDGGMQRIDLRNTSSVAARIATMAHRRLCTTATAIRHRVWDLWGQLTLVEPDSWGPTVSRFLMRYCDGRPGEYGGIVAKGLTNRAELLERLAPTVHRTPYSVTHAQLPPKRREVMWVPVTEQVKAFKWNMKRDEKAAARDGERLKLTEIRVWEAASKKRSAAVREVKVALQDNPRAKLFIAAGRRRDCDELGRLVETVAGKIPGCTVWAAHGGTTQEKRRAIQDAYMEHPGPCVLVGTIDAWGESLNLQQTDIMLVVSLPYTPGKVDQLEGRVHRLGMTRPVLIRYLVAEDTMDEHIAEILLSKIPAVEQVVGHGPLDGLTSALRGTEDRAGVLADLAAMITARVAAPEGGTDGK